MNQGHRIRIRTVLAGIALLISACLGHGNTFYINAVTGNDTNAGTSAHSPFRTLARANALHLQPGDRVLLAAGQHFTGQLAWDGIRGSAAHPVVISSYQPADANGESRPLIDGAGYAAGLLLKNCEHVAVGNLIITANAGGMKPDQMDKLNMRCGVLIEADQPHEFVGFSITNLAVRDVFFEEPGFERDPAEVRSANGTQSYGWGIRVLVSSPARIKNLTIADCEITNVSHTGIKLTGPSNGLEQVDVCRIRIEDTGGPGVQMSGVSGGHFSQLYVNRSGSADDSRKWGRGSGLWTWGSHDVVVENSRFQNAHGPGDSAGVHIDYNCRNVIVQCNFSFHNAGGFCEILGNNHNCAYRYNVSVDDGYRIKGRDGAFQEGKIFWLSGYTGARSPRKGPFNIYFYNNTIYTSKNIAANVSVAPTARGVLIANNIFCFQGRSEAVAGDQKRAAFQGHKPAHNIVFENNLYLRANTWPEDTKNQDRSPIVGDPNFCRQGGDSIKDYIPRNTALIKDRGIVISKLPGDEIGLVGGLKVPRDILGQTIAAKPDMGAIELPRENEQIGSR